MLMEINRTNIFNNTAQFGEVISACNSQVTLSEHDLFVTVDPLLPFCILYEGDIQSYNITAPRDPEIFTTESLTTTEQQTTEHTITTQRLTTTELLTTTESLTTIEPLTTITEPLTTTKPLTTTQRFTTTESLITTEPLTTTDPMTTTEPPTTTAQTTTEAQITTEPLTTAAQTTTESQITEQATEPAATELQMSTEPLSSPGLELLSTTEQPTITELLTPTEPLIPNENTSIVSEPLPTTIDELDVSPFATVTSNVIPTSTVEDTNESDIITPGPSGDTNTLPTATIKGAASIIPEVSPLTTSATTMNEPTSTTESLGEDVDHFTPKRPNRNRNSTRQGG